MNLPIWNGYQGLSEQPESPKWDLSNNRTSIVRVWEGPFISCLTGQPVKGQGAEDLGPLYLAEHISVEHAAGGKGKLTVTFETQGPGGNPDDAPVFEIEWVGVDKPLESHPRYALLPVPGAMPLQIADLIALQMWDNEPSYANRILFKFTDSSGTVETLSTQAQDLAKKKLRGQTSYTLYAPVCRATVSSRTLPTTFGCGFIDTPTVPSTPAFYQFLKTADRATMTGRHTKWEQQEEWTGADSIDSDIYFPLGS